METFILLSLSSLIGLLIHWAFRGVSVLIGRKHKSTTNNSLVREGLAPEKKNDNRYGGPARIFIPNVFARWPWPSRINPNYAVVKKEADAWMTSFQAFRPEAQDAFNRCDFSKCFPSYSFRILICFIGLFACLAYPIASKGKVTTDTLIRLFDKSFIQSMLELLVITCIWAS